MPAPKDPEKYKEFIRRTSEASKGRKHTEEHKQKMRLLFSGESNPFYGKKHSSDSLMKMSEAHTNISEETREKMRKASTGENNWGYGKHRSEETKNKLRITHSGENNYHYGTPLSDAHKKAISEGMKGKAVSEEHRKKISVTLTGRKYSEELRKKLSESHKGLQTRENHPNWKGGVTRLSMLVRGTDEYGAGRQAVFSRDNYTDWFSGLKGNGNIIAHHVIPLNTLIKRNNLKSVNDALNCKMIWDVNNGITMFNKTHNAHHQMWGMK